MMTMGLIPVDLLQTFAAIAEAGSFSGAARQLGLRQSTVSMQIRKLEASTGRRYIDRTTHGLALTPDGELLLEHARGILESHHRLARQLAAEPLRGRLRLGASEDFVLSALPDVLAAFARRHPEVDLELRAGLSGELNEAYDSGRLDLIFVKRHGPGRGTVAWEEPVLWAAHPDYRVDPAAALPLLLYPKPSITRASTLETLERAGRRWRVAFTSASLPGLTAAARAGIGVLPHAARLMPPGLGVLSHPSLPALPALQFAVVTPGAATPVIEALRGTILRWAGSSARLGVT